jgi:hypothetical protein
VESVDPISGYTSLQSAAVNGSVPLAKALVTAGARPDYFGGLAYSPLHLAVREGERTGTCMRHQVKGGVVWSTKSLGGGEGYGAAPPRRPGGSVSACGLCMPQQVNWVVCMRHQVSSCR